MEIYEFLALLFPAIVILVILIVLIYVHNSSNKLKGKPRIIAGEVWLGFGIALIAGAALKYGLSDLEYWGIAFIGFFLLFVGAKLKIL